MRRLAPLTLLGICILSALQFPALVQGFALPLLPIAQLWFEPDAQYRRALDAVPYDALRAADAALPRAARVLLVTDGKDVRKREYTTFHRALYFLSPRAIVWVSPAPRDGTWESNWWHSAPPHAQHILYLTQKYQLDHILFFAPIPFGTRGEIIQRWQGGALVRLEERASKANGARIEFRGLDGVPRGVGALLVVLGTGALVVQALTRAGYRAARGEALALAWLGGAAMISYWLAGALLVGVTLSGAVMLWLIPAAIGLASSWRGGWPSARALFHVPRPNWHWLAAGYLALQIFWVAWLSSAQPQRAWDSWVLWSMKARAIFIDQNLSTAVYADPTRAVTHLNYPLLLPLVNAHFFQWLDAPDDRWLGIVAGCFFLALIMVVFYGVKHLGGDDLRAWLAACAVGSLPGVIVLAGIGYADIPLGVYAVVALLALVRWSERGERGALYLAMLCCACLPWLKREGWVMAACMLFMLSMVAPRAATTWRAIFLCGISALVGAGWWDILVLAPYAAPNPTLLPVTWETLYTNVERAPQLALYFLRETLNPQWSFVLPLAGIVLALRATKFFRLRMVPPRTLLLGAPLLYIVVMTCSYFFSAYAPLSAHLANPGTGSLPR